MYSSASWSRSGLTDGRIVCGAVGVVIQLSGGAGHIFVVMLGDDRFEDFNVIRLLNLFVAVREGDVGKAEAEVDSGDRCEVLLLHLLPHQRVLADHRVALEGIAGVFALRDVIGAFEQLHLIVGLVVVGRVGNKLVMLPLNAVGEHVLQLGIGLQQRKELDDVRQVVGDAVFADAEQILQRVVLGGRRKGVHVRGIFITRCFRQRVDIRLLPLDKGDGKALVFVHILGNITERVVFRDHRVVSVERFILQRGNDEFVVHIGGEAFGEQEREIG